MALQDLLSQFSQTVNKAKTQVSDLFGGPQFKSPVPTPQKPTFIQDYFKGFEYGKQKMKPYVAEVFKGKQKTDELVNKIPIARSGKTLVETTGKAPLKVGQYMAETGRQIELMARNPSYKKMINSPQSMTPRDWENVKNISNSKYLRPDQLDKGRVPFTGQEMSSRSNILFGGLGAIGENTLQSLAPAFPGRALSGMGVMGAFNVGVPRVSKAFGFDSGDNRPVDVQFAEGAGKSLKYTTINKLSDKLLSDPILKIADKMGYLDKAHWLVRANVKGGTYGLANIIEDIIFTPVIEGREPTPFELIISGGSGYTMGSMPDYYKGATGKLKDIISVKKPELNSKQLQQAADEFLVGEFDDFYRDAKGRFKKPDGADLRNKSVQKLKTKYGELIQTSDRQWIRKELGLPEKGMTVEDIPAGLSTKEVETPDIIKMFRKEKWAKPKYKGGSMGPGKYYSLDEGFLGGGSDLTKTLSVDDAVWIIKNQVELDEATQLAAKAGFDGENLSTYAKSIGKDVVINKVTNEAVDTSQIDLADLIKNRSSEILAKQKDFVPRVKNGVEEYAPGRFRKAKIESPQTTEAPSLKSQQGEATRPQVEPNRVDPSVRSSDNIIKTKSRKIKVGNTEYNVGRIKAKDADRMDKATKEALSGTFEKIVGEKMSHKEIVKNANEFSEDLIKLIGEKKTLELGAAQLRLRQNIASMIDDGTPSTDLLESIQKDAAFAKNIARLLGQRAIDATPKTKAGKIKLAYLKSVNKVEADISRILKEAEGVDFEDAMQANAFYRKFVKPSAGEWVDLVRYSSMLSSPNTHIINIVSNWQGTGILTPIQKVVEGNVDSVVSTLTGRKRTRFAGEGVEYAKGYYGSMKKAYRSMMDVFQDKAILENPDFRNIPLTQKGTKLNKVEMPMRFIGKALNAMDQFFKTATEGGLQKSYKYRASKGVDVKADFAKEADKLLFRGDLVEEGGGIVNNFIGSGAKWVKSATYSQNPYFRWTAKMTLPFVNIGTNLTKMGVEGNPLLGAVNLIGNSDKIAGVSKMIMGGTVMALAVPYALDDKITFDIEGKDWDTAKAGGPQPFSILIGDKWISYDKMHPLISFQLATVAGVVDALKKQKIGEDVIGSISEGLWQGFQFYLDQSYFRNVGDLVNGMNGNVELMARIPSNYITQFIPARALMSWVNRIIDQYERKPDTSADFVTKQLQYTMMQIPFLSSQVPTRKDRQGEPIKKSASDRFLGAFSPSKIKTQNPEAQDIYDYYSNSNRSYKNIQKLIDEGDYQKALEVVKELKVKSPTLYRYVNDIFEDVDKGITPKERRMKGKSVLDRTNWVMSEIDKLKTPQEQLDFIKRNKEIGIITSSVLKELDARYANETNN